jgi:ubiquinone/menaquinone biosynthesis C-methylase UbiE
MVDDVATFHRFAGLYDLFMRPPDGEALREGLAMADRPVDRVLDVGGGPGRAARAISARERLVVDPARGMLERARDHGLGAIQADGADLPLTAESVDAVVVTDALHHMGDQPAVLADAARVLRTGGVLVVRDFDPSTVRGRMLVAAEHLVGFDSVFHSPDGLATMIAEAGLEPTVQDRGFTYTVVATAAAQPA